jgi:aminoglycoside phosphotransferase (APT) family kinase protein
VSFLGPRAANRPRLSGAIEAVRRAASRRSALSDARSVVPAALASLSGSADGWSIERASQGGGGISAFVVRSRTGERLMVKVTRSESGHASLLRATGAQRAIAGIEALGAWRTTVPALRSDGQAGAWRFVVETALTGRALTLPAPADPGWDGALSAAMRSIGELHDRTASTRPGTDRRARWLDTRIAAATGLAPVVGQGDPASERDLVAGLERFAATVGNVVGAAHLSAGWIHGDYWPANILVDDAGAVSGIVDWDSAEPDELAAHDIFHLVLYARKLRRHQALGAVVADLLGGTLDAGEVGALERASPPELGLRSTALLYWLRFIEANLRRQPGLATSERWIGSNVGAVVPWL